LRVGRRQWRVRPDLARRLFRIGWPSTVQMFARSLMALALMRVVAGLSVAVMAGYGIGLRLHTLVLMPAFALGNAASTMTGQNLGAGAPGRARRAAWRAVVMDLAIMALNALVMWRWADQLVGVFSDQADVIRNGADYLRLVSPFYLFTGVAIVLGRALDGAGETAANLVFTLIALWGVQVPLAVWLPRRLDPPAHGVWWAVALAVTLHGLLVAGWFIRGRWMHRRV